MDSLSATDLLQLKRFQRAIANEAVQVALSVVIANRYRHPLSYDDMMSLVQDVVSTVIEFDDDGDMVEGPEDGLPRFDLPYIIKHAPGLPLLCQLVRECGAVADEDLLNPQIVSRCVRAYETQYIGTGNTD